MTDDLKAKLTDEQFYVTQQCGTEPPFSGEYWNEKRPGVYRCVVCGADLFDSKSKFESGSGWPSFYEAVDGGRITEKSDTTHGMVRTEITCANCDAHLGHVFPDGPPPTGMRFCVNSASLSLEPRDE
ncbi:MAG: peptide-methionine (R)-S-oxide reductase MsrB [Acidimicrobiia bacterium]|nr:peptide-methionine (R)-S-oxide reductase MsrB [Acidimicrobiia bacterium]